MPTPAVFAAKVALNICAKFIKVEPGRSPERIKPHWEAPAAMSSGQHVSRVSQGLALKGADGVSTSSGIVP